MTTTETETTVARLEAIEDRLTQLEYDSPSAREARAREARYAKAHAAEEKRITWERLENDLAEMVRDAKTASDVAGIAEKLTDKYAKALRQKRAFNSADIRDIARRCQLRLPAFSCT